MALIYSIIRPYGDLKLHVIAVNIVNESNSSILVRPVTFPLHQVLKEAWHRSLLTYTAYRYLNSLSIMSLLWVKEAGKEERKLKGENGEEK